MRKDTKNKIKIVDEKGYKNAIKNSRQDKQANNEIQNQLSRNYTTSEILPN